MGFLLYTAVAPPDNLRSVSTTLALCAATIAVGVALFAGAVYVHEGLYTHNVYKPRDDEGKPPNPLQLEIQEALRQERAKQRAEGRG